MITATGLDWFWEQYLGSLADTRNALAAPAKAGSLAGLPPALVLTTEYEVSRSGELRDAVTRFLSKRFA